MKTSHRVNAAHRNWRNAYGASLTGVALTALLLGSAAGIVQAQTDPAVEGPRVERLAERLNLDEAQRYRVQEIMQSAQERSSADRQRLRELRKAMREATDDGQRAAISDEIGQVTGRLAYERSTAQAAVREVLTPEQRADMDARREAAMEQRREARANGDGSGRPWADGEHPGKGKAKGRPWKDGEHPGRGKGKRPDSAEIDES